MPIPFIYVLITGIVLGVVIGFKTYIPYLYWNETEDFKVWRSAVPHVINYIFWPFLVPFVYWTFEKYKITAHSLRPKLFAVLFSLLIPFVHEVITNFIYFWMMHVVEVYEFKRETWKLLKGAVPSVYIGRIVEFWIIYGLFAAFDYYKKYKDKQAELGKIEAQLNRSKLAVLKMQLQPHFLFNALNSISSLMEVDIEKAQTVTARLGDMLRGILNQDHRVFITVSEELEYVHTYLEIERIRFEDRLETSIHVDDAVKEALIPVLLIQPLVENAIKHGISKSKDGGKITVSVTKDGQKLLIKVHDDSLVGEAVAPDPNSGGIGLKNIKERLKNHYGREARMTAGSATPHGFEVVLHIPIKTKTYEVN